MSLVGDREAGFNFILIIVRQMNLKSGIRLFLKKSPSLLSYSRWESKIADSILMAFTIMV
jgi:hypothetical protein